MTAAEEGERETKEKGDKQRKEESLSRRNVYM